MSKTKLCMSCMTKVPDDATFCPNCRYDGSQENDSYALPIGTPLGERYILGMTLDSDGETITYVGFDKASRGRVIVKEYMPRNGCMRDSASGAISPKQGAEIHYKTGLSDFVEMYGTLRTLSATEPGLITVTDVLELNRTAYAFTEAFDGITFKEFLHLNNDKVTVGQCLSLLEPIFTALSAMHNARLVHRGVSPETIFVSRKGQIKLGGYATASIRTKGTEYPARLYSGYSAPEQYTNNSFQSAATDVYALAATFYSAVTGVQPQSADQRKMFDNLVNADEAEATVPYDVARALKIAMLINQKERTQIVRELQQRLKGQDVAESYDETPEEEPLEQEDEEVESGGENDPLDLFRIHPGRKLSKLENTLRISALSAMILVVVSTIVFFSWQLINSRSAPIQEEDPGTAEETGIPDYSGVALADIVFDNNYNYEIQYVYNDSFDEGVVVISDPRAGREPDEDGRVILKVSKGSHVVTMVNLRGMTPMNARIWLDENNISYSFDTMSDTSAIPGTIYRQNVEAGTEFNAGTTSLILMVAPDPPTPEQAPAPTN